MIWQLIQNDDLFLVHSFVVSLLFLFSGKNDVFACQSNVHDLHTTKFMTPVTRKLIRHPSSAIDIAHKIGKTRAKADVPVNVTPFANDKCLIKYSFNKSKGGVCDNENPIPISRL